MVVFLVCVVYLVIDAIVATFMSSVANNKGYGEGTHVWAVCFWLGVAGWLYVVALPDLISRNKQDEIIELLKSLNETNRNVNDIVTYDKLPEL